MHSEKFDSKYYRNVQRKMKELGIYPRPKLKPTILVTGWNEFLRIIHVEAEI